MDKAERRDFFEKADLKDKLWLILRCHLCNGTTDCENYPECPEGTDGCEAQSIVDEIYPTITEALKQHASEAVKSKKEYISIARKELVACRKLLGCSSGSGSIIDDAVVIYNEISSLKEQIEELITKAEIADKVNDGLREKIQDLERQLQIAQKIILEGNEKGLVESQERKIIELERQLKEAQKDIEFYKSGEGNCPRAVQKKQLAKIKELQEKLKESETEVKLYQTGASVQILQARLKEAEEIIKDMFSAMKKYEMDVEDDAPNIHKKMMDRAKQFLNRKEGK